MSYDYVGEKFRKALDLAKQGRFVEAFNEMIGVLTLVEPYTPGWSKLYEITLRLAERIEEVQERINAYVSLANLLMSKGLRAEAQKLLEKAEKLSEKLTSRIAATKAKQVINAVKGVTAAWGGEERERLLAEFDDLLSRLERLAQLSPHSAEETLVKLKTLLNDLSMSGVDVSDRVERFRAVLAKVRPRLGVRILSSPPSKLETPTTLSVHLEVRNNGLLPAHNVEVRVVAAPGSSSATTTIPTLEPKASKEVTLELYIDRPGVYKLKTILEYGDATGATYRDEVVMAELVAEPRAVLGTTMVIHPAVPESDAWRLDEARQNMVLKLRDVAWDLANLINIIDTRDEKQAYDVVAELVNDLSELKKHLETVLDYASRLWVPGCPTRVQTYRKALQTIETRLEDLKQRLEKRKVFKKTLLTGKIVGLEERTVSALNDIARIVAILLPLEASKRVSEILAEMLETPTEESILIAITTGIAVGLTPTKLKTLYIAANMLKSGFLLPSKEEYKEIIESIRKLATEIDTEVIYALRCR